MLSSDARAVAHEGALMLASADVRILISAITFFTLLLILPDPDGNLVLASWIQGGFLDHRLSEKLLREGLAAWSIPFQ
jgi:hypothetical protein